MENEWIEEEIIRYKQIKKGHTNISYYLKTKTNEYFYQIFKYDKHNHKLKSQELFKFDFVPETYYYSTEEMVAQYYRNEKFIIDKTSLKEMANILLILHSSNRKFPKCNIDKRIKYYYSMVKNKDNIPEELINKKKYVLSLLKNLSKTISCHNDPWIQNFFLNNKKYYLGDWEYATMNNKHFDIAYIIASSYFTEYQEKLFLEFYGDYNEKELKISKIIVYYITLLWIFKQKNIPFPYKPLLKSMNILIKEISN